jgi:hypothetical protein
MRQSGNPEQGIYAQAPAHNGIFLNHYYIEKESRMKKTILFLFGILLFNINVYAQSFQRGRATQEMDGAGFFIAHSSFPIGDIIKVVNTITGDGVDAVVSARIEESSDRIVDLSFEVWDVLGLVEDDEVILTNVDQFSLSDVPVFILQDEDIIVEIEGIPAEIPTVISQQTQTIETTRPKTTQPMYHLLILDRVKCKTNSDISGLQDIKMLYKFKHGKNGYLIAVYVSSGEGQLPVMPDKSRVLVNLTGSSKAFLRDYTNSSVFRRFVTNRRVISQLREALK